MSSIEDPVTPAPAAPLLRLEGLTKCFGDQPVLSGVSVALQRRDVLALIGVSGSGKSTLLRCINSLEEYEGGAIYLRGERLSYRGTGVSRRRYGDRRLAAERARIGMVFQSFNLFPHLDAEENITLGLRRVCGRSRADAREVARHWLAQVGLPDRGSHYPHQLSGGQQQRVAIARALATEPELILLDEVTSALDPELVGEVLTVIRDLARAGTTMIVVSHEMAFVRDVADRVAFMHGGRIVEIGPPGELFEAPSTPQLVSLLSRFRYTSARQDAPRAIARDTPTT